MEMSAGLDKKNGKGPKVRIRASAPLLFCLATCSILDCCVTVDAKVGDVVGRDKNWQDSSIARSLCPPKESEAFSSGSTTMPMCHVSGHSALMWTWATRMHCVVFVTWKVDQIVFSRFRSEHVIPFGFGIKRNIYVGQQWRP